MATIMQSLAALANKTPLRRLQNVCENQASISTQKLGDYLEQIGDDMTKLAADLRAGFDGLVAEKTRRHGHDTRKPLGYIRQSAVDLILDPDVDASSTKIRVFTEDSEGSVPVYLHSDWVDGMPSTELALRQENERLRAMLAEFQVPETLSEPATLAENQGVSIQKDMFGTVHIMVSDFDMVQIQYDHRFNDNASQNRLARSIAAMWRQPASAGIDE